MIFVSFVHTTRKLIKTNTNIIYNKMEELINELIHNTLGCFDIPFCITVNVATYLIIKGITDAKPNLNISIWHKRVVLLILSIIIGCFYYITGTDFRTLLNSTILAPVAWSWIFKPICSKLGIDYNSKDITEDNDKEN